MAAKDVGDRCQIFGPGVGGEVVEVAAEVSCSVPACVFPREQAPRIKRMIQLKHR